MRGTVFVEKLCFVPQKSLRLEVGAYPVSVLLVQFCLHLLLFPHCLGDVPAATREENGGRGRRREVEKGTDGRERGKG